MSAKGDRKTSTEIRRDEIVTINSGKLLPMRHNNKNIFSEMQELGKCTSHSLFLKVPQECSP